MWEAKVDVKRRHRRPMQIHICLADVREDIVSEGTRCVLFQRVTESPGLENEEKPTERERMVNRKEQP